MIAASLFIWSNGSAGLPDFWQQW